MNYQPNQPRDTLHIRIKPEILDAFRKQARKERRQQSEVIEAALSYYIAYYSEKFEVKLTGT